MKLNACYKKAEVKVTLFFQKVKSSQSESESESESEDNSEESATKNSEASNSDETAPPASKRTKEEGWKWFVTGDRPSKFHFTGNPGIKPAMIRNLPPEPNPLEVFQLMVNDSLWDEIATETNRFAVQFFDKNPNSPTISQWFPTTSHEIKAYLALCVLMAQVKNQTCNPTGASVNPCTLLSFLN